MKKFPTIKLLAICVAILSLFGCSYLLVQATGINSSTGYWEISYKVLCFALFILFLSSAKKTFYWVLLPLILLYTIYTPIGMNFGAISYQHIISLVATDLSEGQEFLSLISTKYYLYAICIPVLLFLFRKITLNYDFKPYKNKKIIISTVFFLSLQLSPLVLITNLSESIEKVYAELKLLNETKFTNDWGDTTRRSDIKAYDNYILIIGESARRDYHHLYGYPVENTPFLDKTNGTIIEGLTVPDTYTVGSLKRMLTLSDTGSWKENYNLNLVDLMKSAGIKTYWLSNQGYLGKYDTPLTALANRSDLTYFLKAGDYDSLNTSDYDLLPKFRQLVNEKSETSRFFVLHLYASHVNPCERLTDYPTIFPENKIKPEYKKLNCYISTIKKTDHFIEQVVDIMKQNQKESNQSFSIVYFSDHGLSHIQEDADMIEINNAKKGKYHQNVPLVKISSDDTERKHFKVFKSGLTFTNGIAHWVGISNSKLDPNRDLFSNQNDSNDFGQKSQIEQRVLDDPAIDIRP